MIDPCRCRGHDPNCPNHPNGPVRDPQKVLDALKAYLEVYPDMRVAQAISLASWRHNEAVDCYYLEDNDLAKQIELMILGL